MNRDEVAAVYAAHFNPSMASLYDAAGCPVEVSGEGNYVIDEQGRRYLDFCCGYGVFAFGHQNPSIHRAVMNYLNGGAVGSPWFKSPAEVAFTERLAELLPGDLEECFIARSGSEANELALRLAISARPKRKKFVAAINSYHGKSLGVLGLMGQSHLRDGFGSMVSDVTFVPYGDVAALVAAVTEQTCAVFLEPVLGGGYITVPPEGYLAAVSAHCAETGALLVIDEVQTGLGRMGARFGIEAAGIVPDIVVLSKGLTGGYVPMAVAVARKGLVAELAHSADILEDVQRDWPMGAMGLGCAAGKASLDFMVAADIAPHVAQVGADLRHRLQILAQKYPRYLCEVPGIGLMMGAKMTSNILENALWLQLLKRNVLAGFSTNHVAKRPTLRLCPVLTLTPEECDYFVEAVDDSLAEIQRKPSLLYRVANEALRVQYYMPGFALKLGGRLIGAGLPR